VIYLSSFLDLTSEAAEHNSHPITTAVDQAEKLREFIRASLKAVKVSEQGLSIDVTNYLKHIVFNFFF